MLKLKMKSGMAVVVSVVSACMGGVGGDAAHADTIKVGNGDTPAPSILNNIALDPNYPNTTYSRYQQVYGAPAFSALSGPVKITSLTFFAAEGVQYSWPGIPPWTVEIPEADRVIAEGNYTIRLSTTSKAVDGLGDTFNDNWGSDVQVFFEGDLEDTVTITGSTPFTYDPSMGNLLLDITVNSQVEGNTGQFFRDMETSLQFENGDTDQMSSRVGYNTTTAVTTGVDWTRTGGFATEFSYTLVPEPSSAAGLAVLGLVLMCRRGKDGRKTSTW